MRSFGLYVTKDRKNVAWVALVFALLPFLGLPTGWICIIIIGLITLHKGAVDGLWVLAWVALPAIALSFVGYPMLLVSMVFLRGLMVWAFALILRRFHSWAMVLEVAALLGVCVIFIIHLLKPDIQAWWTTQLTTYVNQLNASFQLQFGAKVTQTWVKLMSPVASGLVGLSILVVDLLLLLMARWWQASLFNPGGLSNEFYQLRVSHIASVLLIISLIAIGLGSAAVLDALPLILLPFIFGGISLLHVIAFNKKAAVGILWLVYILMLPFLPYVVAALALIGFADSWFDFRRRFSLATTKTK